MPQPHDRGRKSPSGYHLYNRCPSAAFQAGLTLTLDETEGGFGKNSSRALEPQTRWLDALQHVFDVQAGSWPVISSWTVLGYFGLYKGPNGPILCLTVTENVH